MVSLNRPGHAVAPFGGRLFGARPEGFWCDIVAKAKSELHCYSLASGWVTCMSKMDPLNWPGHAVSSFGGVRFVRKIGLVNRSGPAVSLSLQNHGFECVL